jgi:peptide/nickel transport system ATP-binding protein
MTSFSASGSDPILSVEGLTVSFRSDNGWRPVVRNLSFSIAASETVAIVGESGSGKSVTALSIMRLLPDDARVRGKTVLAGVDIAALSEKSLRKVRGNDVAMIFQEPMTSLNPVRTIGFQIAEALMLHRDMRSAEAHAETLRLLDRVRIPSAHSRFSDYPHQFSGGMRQRVMIAMALAGRPKLLIADEPTTALDVTIQAQILELIRQLQDEERMSVLFITQDMGVVADIANHTVVMLEGEAVEAGKTGRVFSNPAHPYTKSLLAAVPKLDATSSRRRPLRFPVIDRATGNSVIPLETPDTVKADAPPLLEVSNLTTRFDVRSSAFGRVVGRVHAVENISFSLQPGETLALVGESGCGKSTTGRSIVRLVEPDSGVVCIDGEDILRSTKNRVRGLRRRVQMIFQDPFASLDPRMSIGASLAEPLLTHGLTSRVDAVERSAELLRQVGLSPDMSRRLPHEFSGGQRQRICIARALAVEPRLIIADEAVSALDVSVKAQVINLMLDLQARMGLAYLFISHDIALVNQFSHRVAVMYLGEIVEIGPRAAIFGSPQHPYTRRLLAAASAPGRSGRYRSGRLSDAETRSSVRPLGYVAAPRSYREISPGHVVQTWGEEWEARGPDSAPIATIQSKNFHSERVNVGALT